MSLHFGQLKTTVYTIDQNWPAIDFSNRSMAKERKLANMKQNERKKRRATTKSTLTTPVVNILWKFEIGQTYWIVQKKISANQKRNFDTEENARNALVWTFEQACFVRAQLDHLLSFLFSSVVTCCVQSRKVARSTVTQTHYPHQKLWKQSHAVTKGKKIPQHCEENQYVLEIHR